MSSLLVNDILPLWVWIVIILAGSSVIIGTLAFTVRYVLLRRRDAGFVETFGSDDPPQRRVTVRRGRVVPSSKHLSLTGSRFGVNTYTGEENDGSRARSRSPFEWWAAVKDRSYSRQSQITSNPNDSWSALDSSTPTSVRGFYQQSDIDSTLSLPSTTEKYSTLSVRELESRIPPPRRPKHTNFSRSFGSQKLSRIEEFSPHESVSIAETEQLQTLESDTIDSAMATQQQGQTRLQNERLGSAQTVHPSATVGASASKRRSARHKCATSGSISTLEDVISVSEVPCQALDIERTGEAVHSDSPRGRSPTALPEIGPTEVSWDKVSDAPAKRRSTHKGNVLRKKSLQRGRITSMIAS